MKNGNMETYDIFLSYSHKDNEKADLISSYLTKLGWRVWKDQRLTVGSDFSNEISGVLNASKIVVVLWSSSSVTSEWVRKEACLSLSKKKYFPIMIEHADLPQEVAKYHAEGLLRWSGDLDEEQFGLICLQLFERIPVQNSTTEKFIEKAKNRRDFFFNAASTWSSLSEGVKERTEIKWPFWMVRFIVSNSNEAFEDLVWSVGGSPPYGGVGYDEASALYELLEDFKGVGRASERSYAKVEKFIINKPVELKALEAFRIFDKVASNSDSYTLKDLRIGNEDAVNLVDQPLTSYFNLLKAGLFYKNEDVVSAYEFALKAIDPLLTFAQHDSVYNDRLSGALTNAAVFCNLNGDLTEARRCAAELVRIGRGELLDNFQFLAGAVPQFGNEPDELDKTAWELMEDKRPHEAIEWYVQAEKLYRVRGNYAKLGGLLGDMAVCYRRMGNIQMAIKTNRRAIEECQRLGDTLGIYRWCQNLAGILMRMKDYEAAFPYLRLSLYSSAKLGLPNDIKLSASALYEYKGYDLCTIDDVNEMYKTALELLDGNSREPNVKQSMSILKDFINNKIHFATMPEENPTQSVNPANKKLARKKSKQS